MNFIVFLKALDKRMLRRVIFFLLLTALAVTIFMLSAQEGDDSTELSGDFISIFCEIIVPKFRGFDGAQRADFVESLQLIVRKCAHFTAYFILSAFAMQFFLTFERFSPLKLSAALSTGFCLLYAVSDEIHQYFVPGRSCQLRDVLIDTSGALLSAVIQSAVIFLLRRKRTKTKSDKKKKPNNS